jgi:hexosaminidase
MPLPQTTAIRLFSSFLAAVLLAAFISGSQSKAAGADFAIVPCPAKMETGDGQFVIDATTTILANGSAVEEAEKLADYLAAPLGRRIEIVSTLKGNERPINLLIEQKPGELGQEGYSLDVTPQRITLRAARPAGLFYGIQTLRQLLPPTVYKSSPAEIRQFPVPCVLITDSPRFAWRGLMLDTVRHFMPKDEIKKLIAAMAVHKLNSLQLHLTDDQGWRIEIKKYPKLTEVGAWRNETIVGRGKEKPPRFDGQRHGGFYTQDDLRELVAFARRHHINIVPEIEMPGHAAAALAAYPELSCFPDRPHEVWTRWGINPDIFNPDDRTIAFLQDVLVEVMDIFPSQFIHIGGDEAVKDYWKQCPLVQQRIRDLGLADEEQLQNWFIRQMDVFLTQHGRRLIGWDEILQTGLSQEATIMNWHGAAIAKKAAEAGHDVVMAPMSHTYFDYYQGPPDKEPLAIGGNLPLEKVYSFEPIPSGLTPEQAKHILGAQGQVWTEYIPTPRQAEYMIWPRAAALAEVAWSPAKAKDYADFLRRLSVHLKRLDAMQVSYRPL